MKTSRKLWLATTLGIALATSGCWSDDDDVATTPSTPTPPVTTPVTAPPAAINDSVANFIGYLLVLVGQVSDGEPLDISSVTAPVSDTAEPTTLP
jgi:hypothetical protein